MSGYGAPATSLPAPREAGGAPNPTYGDFHGNPDYSERPEVRGKFLYVGKHKYWVRGVTYGTFRPREEGSCFPDEATVECDFTAMAAHGINTVRTYEVPPRWLLDAARCHGLRVMVGLPWTQHVAFLDDRRLIHSIEKQIRAGVQACAGHPAVLCYAIGNEIPAAIVRWHGRRHIERFLHRLYRLAKAEDPGALVTYVNFPTTEYLQISFLDLVCFNVYLESRERLEAYLARLQNLAGERPLLMAEIGLDSRRNGLERQAESLDWQIRTAFAAGCAGAFVFAWTDEWYRGGYDIDDWDFGLTTRERAPKPALATVRAAFAEAPFPSGSDWPRISVVVCSYNGSRTIRDTLEGLRRLDYPNYEVIVVNDGSTDNTAAIAGEYDFRLFSTENRGLSNARNFGWQQATGEIVAYIDDDAYPDPHWLQYLAYTFKTTAYVGVGGPNLAPPGDGRIADCIANAPGGPVQVLLTDRTAEHIPGCNMAFRRTALAAIEGFDPRYRTAGDDVDLCWRLQAQGWKIGFHAAAVDWHHRRNSVRTYWRQQQGYGRAEALLEEKWPEKYNVLGHATWAGRLYGKGWTLSLGGWGGRLYQGVWGSAPYQSLYQPAPRDFWSWPLMPEWYLLIALLAALTVLGFSWPPLLWGAPLLLGAIVLPVGQAIVSAARARFTSQPKGIRQYGRLYAITAFLHLQQPLARLIGRLKHGLTPWRMRGDKTHFKLFTQNPTLWQESWEDSNMTLDRLRAALRRQGAVVITGGDYDDWDLFIRGGLFGGASVLMATEEHGAGRQLKRFRIAPRYSRSGIGLALLLAAICWAAGLDHAWVASAIAGVGAVFLTLQLAKDSGRAVGMAAAAVASLAGAEHKSL